MRTIRITVLTAGCFLALLSACHFHSLPPTSPPNAPSATDRIFESIEEEDFITTSSSAAPEEISSIPPITSIEEYGTTSPSLSTEEILIISTDSSTEEGFITSPILFTEEPYVTPPTSLIEESSSAAIDPPPPPQISSTKESSPETSLEDCIETTTESVTAPITEPAPVLNRSRAEEAFQLQNQLLADHDIAPLLWSEPLYEVAAQRVQQISSDYSHSGCPDWVAENILMGTNRADLAVQIWYDSPGHQRNMLAGWTYGAIANYGFCWVAIYAMVEAP